MTNVTNSMNEAVRSGVADHDVVVHQDDAVMHELKARKQEQGDKVNSEQRVIDPADGGFMVEALNLGSGGTSDGVAVPEARKQEQGDKVNSEQRIIDPADGGMMIEAVNPGSGGASATRWP